MNLKSYKPKYLTHEEFFFSILSVSIFLLFLIVGCNSGANDASKKGDGDAEESNIRIYSIKIASSEDPLGDCPAPNTCVDTSGGDIVVICVRCLANGGESVTITDVKAIFNNGSSPQLNSGSFTVPCNPDTTSQTQTPLTCPVPTLPADAHNLNVSFDVTWPNPARTKSRRSHSICVQ